MILAHLLQKHWVALFLAAAIGMVSAAPYLYFALQTQTPIRLMGQDAEEHYLARIQEVRDGYLQSGSVFLPTKDTPYLSPNWGEILLARIGDVTHLSTPDVALVAKVVFPLLVFVCFYTLIYLATLSRLAGILSATTAMLGEYLLSNPWEMLNVFHGISSASGTYWARPVNPQISGLLFACGILLVYLLYIEKRPLSRWYSLAVGSIVGSALYVSPYTWGFLMTLLGVLFLWHSLQKHWELVRRLTIEGAVALGFSAPFLYNFLQAKSEPGYTLAALTQGAFTSHAPVVGFWVFVLIMLPLVLRFTSITRLRLFFALCGVAILIALNQQIITGFYLQPGHFHWYTTKPLVGLMLSVMLWAVLVRTPKSIAYTVAGAVITVLFVHTVNAQVRFYHVYTPASYEAQNYAPVLTHFSNVSSERTVFANPTLSDYLAIYTSTNAPGSNYAGLYINPPEYFEKRLMLELYLRNIKPQETLSTLTREREQILVRLYGIYYKEALAALKLTEEAVLQRLAHMYMTQNQDLRTLARELGITDIILDTKNDTWRAQSSIPSRRIGEHFILYHIEP